MHDVSQAYKNAKGLGFALTLETVIEGEPHTLTYDDLLSFKFSGNGTSDELLSFGYTASCNVSFSLDNIRGQWDGTSFDGAKWTLRLGRKLSQAEIEAPQIGVFTTSEAIVGDGSISIKVEDNMVKFEERFKGINFPCTIHDLVLACCKQCGVTFKTITYPNRDFVISGAYQLTQITCRKVLSLAAELCGCFAIINEFGELELRWFDTLSPVAEFSSDDILEFKPDKETTNVSGTSVVFNGVTYSYGEGSKMINLTEDNRLLLFCSPEQIQEILMNIYNEREANLFYNAATFSALGEPALEIGDTIVVEDRNGMRHTLLVSGFILSNNLKMDITSPQLTQADDSVSASSESGSIPRETAESVNVFVSKNERSTLGPDSVISGFLEQRFASESSATPLFLVTLVGNATTAGNLTIDVIIDGMSVSRFVSLVQQGSYLQTFICPVSGLISGNHTVSLQLTSDSALNISFRAEESPIAGSVMVVQGSKISAASSWDGVISLSDSIRRIKVRDSNQPVSARDEFSEAVLNGTMGPTICQTISVGIVRSKPKLSGFTYDTSITQRQE